MEVRNNKVTSNLIWRLLERFGAQGVTFIVSIVLARILDPVIYGTVAIVTVFTTILQVFVDSGFGTALIQKKDADDLDFSTIFWFNIVMCVVLYILMFFCSPLIAKFYDLDELTLVTRIMSLTLIISGVKNIQQAYVSRHLMFKKFFFSTLIGTITAAVVGIVMAVKGYGIWALVVQNLVNQTIDTIVLWITVKWRPKFQFSWKRFKGLFSYGWKLLLSALIDTAYNDVRQLIIGKIYTSEDLAYYNRGKQIPNLVVTNINSSIDSVLLPVMSKEQENKERVREMTRKAIKVSTYIMMPMMVGIAVCARPIVILLLTEKWLPAVFFLQIFCITYAFYPIHTANLNAIKAMGRSDLFLILEIIKKVIGITSILITMFISVEAMAYSLLFTTLASMIINSWPNKKLLNYSFFDQIKDMLPQIVLSVVMGGIVYCISFFNFSNWLTLLIQVPLGVLIYLLGSYVFKLESFKYCLNVALNMINRKKHRATVSNTAIDDATKEEIAGSDENDKDNIDEKQNYQPNQSDNENENQER